MKKFDVKTIFWIIVVVLGVSGCGLGQAEKGRKPISDWSRGLPIGLSVAGTADLLVVGEGERMHLIWPVFREDRTVFRYEQFDETAEPVVAHDLVLPTGGVRRPRLLFGEGDNIHLFWSHRPEGSVGWQLWHVLLNDGGELVTTPQRLSSDEDNVLQFVLAQRSGVGGAVLWQDDRGDNIYLQSIVGNVVTAVPILVAEGATSPAMQFDEQDVLHLAWIDGNNNIFYQTMALDSGDISASVRVADFATATGDRVSGPQLGITDAYVYLFWAIFSQSGEEGGTGRTLYVSFPNGDPDYSRSERIIIMPQEEQPYQAYEGNYALTEFVAAPTSPAMGGQYVYAPDVATSRGGEVAVAVSAYQQFRLDTYTQMAVALFDEGVFQGYQMTAKTESFSDSGVLVADDAGHMHLLWREGAGGRKLYYASTAPTTRAAIDRIDSGDVINATMQGGFEAVTSMLFFPFALGWMLPGVLVIGLWRLRGSAPRSLKGSALVLLVIGIVLYQIAKFLFLPTVLWYVPFSAWLDLPVSWSWPLRVLTPLVIFGIGLGLAELQRRRAGETSVLGYYFIACAVDSLLSLAVYGVNFLGVF